MYGVPLTIYLLWGWLAGRVEGLDLLSHDAGHLWQTLLGWKGDSHASPIHLLSGVLIADGFILLARAWTAFHAAQREHRLATAGPYERIRHPQYAAFIVIMLGFLVQWADTPSPGDVPAAGPDACPARPGGRAGGGRGVRR